MIIEISIGVAVFIFAVLAFFAIRALLALQVTLRRVDLMLLEMEIKAKQFDSSLRTISNVGDIAESETDRLKRKYLEKKEAESCECTDDLVEWVIASIKLGTKLLSRR